MKKAHRDRDQSVRGHSALTKAEQFSPVAWSVATVRTVLVDGKFCTPVTSCERSAGASWLRLDLNQRSPGYEPGGIPNFPTERVA